MDDVLELPTCPSGSVAQAPVTPLCRGSRRMCGQEFLPSYSTSLPSALLTSHPGRWRRPHDYAQCPGPLSEILTQRCTKHLLLAGGREGGGKQPEWVTLCLSPPLLAGLRNKPGGVHIHGAGVMARWEIYHKASPLTATVLRGSKLGPLKREKISYSSS